jgi:hypothetical protein
LEGLDDDIGAFALESRPVRIQKGMQWDRLDRDEKNDDIDGGDGDGDDGDGGMGGDDDEDPSFAEARLWRSFGPGVPRTARVLQCFHLPRPTQAAGRAGEGDERASHGVAPSDVRLLFYVQYWYWFVKMLVYIVYVPPGAVCVCVKVSIFKGLGVRMRICENVYALHLPTYSLDSFVVLLHVYKSGY